MTTQPPSDRRDCPSAFNNPASRDPEARAVEGDRGAPGDRDFITDLTTLGNHRLPPRRPGHGQPAAPSQRNWGQRMEQSHCDQIDSSDHPRRLPGHAHRITSGEVSGPADQASISGLTPTPVQREFRADLEAGRSPNQASMLGGAARLVSGMSARILMADGVR
jgi:hypothetical protein